MVSNSVSNFVESVTNNETEKIEVTSTEDMLHLAEEGKENRLIEEWMKHSLQKMICTTCRIQTLRCSNHSKKYEMHAAARPDLNEYDSDSQSEGQEINNLYFSFQKN